MTEPSEATRQTGRYVASGPLASEPISFGMRGCVVPDWFRRFGDIPGVLHTPREQIDRSSLVGCDNVPEVHIFRFDGQPKGTLSWPVGNSTHQIYGHFVPSSFDRARTALDNAYHKGRRQPPRKPVS